MKKLIGWLLLVIIFYCILISVMYFLYGTQIFNFIYTPIIGSLFGGSIWFLYVDGQEEDKNI